MKNPREFLPGDIVSMEGHVWISLGTCEDGSVLLVHSSPPGVSVCGTSIKQLDGSANGTTLSESMAIHLAMEYMEKHHPEWQKKYSNRKVTLSYIENVVVFRWSKSVMLDAEEMQEKSAEEIMGILLPAM